MCGYHSRPLVIELSYYLCSDYLFIKFFCDSPDQRGEAELDLLVEGHVLVLDEAPLLEVLVAILFLHRQNFVYRLDCKD